MRNKIYVAVLIILISFSGDISLAGDHQPVENYIPIDDIFISTNEEIRGRANITDENMIGKAEAEHSSLFTTMLFGMLIAILTVTSAGKAYSRLFNKVNSDLTLIRNKKALLIEKNTIIHDNRINEILSEYEMLTRELSDHEKALRLMQGEAV